MERGRDCVFMSSLPTGPSPAPSFIGYSSESKSFRSIILMENFANIASEVFWEISF
ncbi:unnamed protein product [Penicillium nalgiovense]|nr:unnamed protein product [Penicillium nalgiovense]